MLNTLTPETDILSAQTQKPPFIASNIPDELKANKRWCVYTLSESKRKHPLDANMREMKWGNPDNWLTYKDAHLTFHGRDKADGIGYFLGSGIWGIDIDHCITDGIIANFAINIVQGINSYTEISPSGTGIHILFRSPDTMRGRDRRKNKLGIEIYDGEESRRYFTVTGNVFGDYNTLRDVSWQTLDAFFKTFLPPAQEQLAQNVTPTPSVVLEGAQATDAEIINRLRENQKACALYDGDMSAYGNDHSRADLALANYLVIECKGDAVRAERIFGYSALGRRDKWQKRADYRQMTMRGALESYDPNYRAKRKQDIAYDDFDSVIGEEADRAPQATESPVKPDVVQTPTATAPNTQTPPQAPPQQPTGQPEYASQSLADGFLQDGWEQSVVEFKVNSNTRTGWQRLDSKIYSLYPGLYVLGAQPGAGKTTWAWQLSDQLATSGRKVIYVTLEQTPFEMVSKSIARRAYQLSDDVNSPSSISVRRGVKTIYTRKALEDFTAQAAPNIHVYEGTFGTTVESLEAYLTQQVEALTAYDEAGHAIRPAIVIDYLQLIGTKDEHINASDTTRTKHAIEVLKKFQRKNGLIMIVIVAYSRDAYDTKTGIGSSRDSSGVEYTADVVMGLDLSVHHEGKPLTAQGAIDKFKWARKLAEAKKAKEPNVTLTVVKNRFGIRFGVDYKYHAKHECFTEV